MATTPLHNEILHFGTWTTDAAGLPCFDLRLPDDEALDAPFRHLISSGHLSALADRWGNVNAFTTEGGFLWLNSPDSAFTRSSLYLMAEIGGELVSLLHSELTTHDGIRIGCGYVEYRGTLRAHGAQLQVRQHFYAFPDRRRALQGHFFLTNLSEQEIPLRLELRSDVTPSLAYTAVAPEESPAFDGSPGRATFRQRHPQLGDVHLLADVAWAATSHLSTLRLSRELVLLPGRTFDARCTLGYRGRPDIPRPSAEPRQNTCHVIRDISPRDTAHDVTYYVTSETENPSAALPALAIAQNAWRRRLASFAVDGPEPWMRQECLWASGQLLAFTGYDSSTGEYYPSLGGYGWPGFSVREVSETSMVLAKADWEFAAGSLRFVAKTQLASGDVPKFHSLRRDRQSHEFDSDNELWFVLGCVESVRTSGQTAFLDETCPFWDGGESTIWEHLKRAFRWVRNSIGRGAHGLILMRAGDWNDYLARAGIAGRGESVMNSGMACRAFTLLAQLAAARGEVEFQRELETYCKELRAAVAAAFDREWFVRGYTDSGRAFGSFAEDRLFINAQTWSALGGCGTPEQRRTALLTAVKRCHSQAGMLLMSRPYSSPPPDDISGCAIPAGEGENAGIWPQTIHWLAWALAEEGMTDEALKVWKSGTLREHARNFPRVPFGIFNGPDCYSSHWAGAREGWTQAQLIDRARFAPMNPAVAWQSFSLGKILGI